MILHLSAMGYLYDGVISLLRPESFSLFLSYSNLVIPERYKIITTVLISTKRRTLMEYHPSSKGASSCKWPIADVP